jgi:hypothetical protein
MYPCQYQTPTATGGNTDAALDRLGRCRELLIDELAQLEELEGSGGNGTGSISNGGGSSTHDAQKAAADADAEPAVTARALACRLGAVCGSLGDCLRQRGDLAAAEDALRQSAGHLRRHAAADPEAAHALSVTLGKLGDLQFWKVRQQQQEEEERQEEESSEDQQQQLAEAAKAAEAADAAEAPARTPEQAAVAAALVWYDEALDHRRALAGPLGASGGGAAAAAGPTLDLVAALVKVADAREVGGGEGGKGRAVT